MAKPSYAQAVKNALRRPENGSGASETAHSNGGCKYGNRKTVVDGITFDSAAEARRYGELKILESAGEITELILQPRYDVEINQRKVCTYVADFFYLKDGVAVIEDTKGFKTPVYRLKKRLVEAFFDMKIMETK